MPLIRNQATCASTVVHSGNHASDQQQSSLLVSFVDVCITLNDAHVSWLAQTTTLNGKVVVYFPAEKRASIGIAIQQVAIYINSPEHRREVVQLCLHS